MTPYDATYVALAEVLGCEPWTADQRLAKAPGAHCAIPVLSRPLDRLPAPTGVLRIGSLTTGFLYEVHDQQLVVLVIDLRRDIYR